MFAFGKLLLLMEMVGASGCEEAAAEITDNCHPFTK